MLFRAAGKFLKQYTKTQNLRSLRFLSSNSVVTCYKQNRTYSQPWKTGSLLCASACAVTAVTYLTTNDVEGKSTLLEEKTTDEDEEITTIVNWSGTHSVDVLDKNYYEPETIADLEKIVAKCHKEGKSIRPVGSALSPNAISFNGNGMVSLSNLDRVIKIDKENMTVTVEAGARVSQVIDALREHGLTLPNLASIAEQQMGGFTQIGAHGTGANIPPVDEFVTCIKLVTPARGTVELTPSDGEMFNMAKVGLGCLGVVGEITMKVIPAHNLLEHTYVLSRSEAKEQLNGLLKKHKHIRYMWIPYQDAVVVVTNDPEDENSSNMVEESKKGKQDIDASKPLKELLKELSKDTTTPLTDDSLKGTGFGELRDKLLAFNALDGDHVTKVNESEALFWKQSEGYQIKPSDQLLQFDCGGQQWVFEVCFPTGNYEENSGHDMQFMTNLLQKIESQKIPAHAPIEQRWSASSSSSMSPAHGPKEGLHCWVGIIMYLPSDDETERNEITKRFQGQYCDLVREVGLPFGIVSHWGKLEMPISGQNFLLLRKSMASRYPLQAFNASRQYYDPKNILGNDLLDLILGKPM
jgi:L-galactono-1,4-lactone dehydrogenase